MREHVPIQELTEKKLRLDFAKLDRAFNPRCIAIVGDSKRNDFQWLRGESEFKGRLYSVQVNPETNEEIKALGIDSYPSLVDIPDSIDLVIVTAPRAAAHMILEQCICKDVAAAHFFTAGFSETDTEEGIKLEQMLVERAKESNFLLIGPNCRGIFNPKIGLKQIGDQYSGISGPVGFISQSGTHAMNFSWQAHFEGVDINKSVSFGNGLVLDSADYLEYFGQDPEIKIVALYLEGVRDGRRFFKVLKEVAARKPVVVWKGGQTEDGERATASHTGSLAVSQTIWDTAMTQCGVIRISSLEEMIDTLKALIYLPPVRGDKVAVAGGTGGESVVIADVFGRAGLRMPLLTQASYDELATFFSLIGGSYRNPLDTDAGPNRRELARIMEILERDANIDNLLLLTRPGSRFHNIKQVEEDIFSLVNIRKKTSKPVMAILSYSSPEEMAEARDIAQRLQSEGIPAFSSIERTAIALKNALDYYNFKNIINV